MKKINELDFHVANLIAAGEVVERPASVVKELLENALDSGADSISVEIQNGGISFIRVSDNGCGMDPEDVPISIRRHATSKIKNAEDLSSIMTLGFRGEALAAIAAVSKLRIMTKTPDAQVGTLLESENGKITDLREVGCPDGTTVIVEDLFANVPARFKFLKRNVTEAMAVSSVVEKIALSRPDIRFQYVIDGDMRLSTSGDGNIGNTAWSVLGADFVKHSVAVCAQEEGIQVEGLIGTSENVRSNRNWQLFFINQRYIRSRTISSALEQAFSSYIPSEKFPCCVLYLRINPALVDVNVHPAKLEVKFSNDKRIFETVFYAVRNALNVQARPQRSFSDKPGPVSSNPAASFVPVTDKEDRDSGDTRIPLTDAVPKSAYPSHTKQTDSSAAASSCFKNGFSPTSVDKRENDLAILKTLSNSLRAENAEEVSRGVKFSIDIENDEDADFIKQSLPTSDKISTEVSKSDESEKSDAFLSGTPLRPYTIIGELFCTYIIAEFADKVVFIDKHAAHERILYEKLRNRISNENHYSKILLLPIAVPVCSADLALIEEYRDALEEAGFSFEFQGGSGVVSLTQVPSYIAEEEAANMFMNFISAFGDGKKDAGLSRELILEKAFYTVACKAAIKAGRIYSMEELYEICDALFAKEQVKVCPHGRPVAFEMAKRDFDKQFGR